MTARGGTKRVIDSRVTLQARRLLARTGEPVAVIARRPGLSGPTDVGWSDVPSEAVSP